MSETETKHASKNWHASPTAGHDKHGQTAIYDDATGRDVAIVYDGKENADIIAAAPDLLRSLKLAKTRITEMANAADATWNDWPGAYEIDRAISQAEGDY